MKIFRYIVASIVILTLLALFVIGSIAPETSVYLGRQVPKNYIKEIKELKLLSDGEKIVYFYSDGFTDIKDGMYFVTNQNVVAYNNLWEEPETIIPFKSIDSLSVDYDDSFLEDSYIFIRTLDGLELTFPVSSEQKRDRLFYEFIRKKLIE
jgi:hypothetical protein